MVFAVSVTTCAVIRARLLCLSTPSSPCPWPTNSALLWITFSFQNHVRKIIYFWLKHWKSVFSLLTIAGTCNQANSGATRAVNSRYCGPFLNPISTQAASSTVCGKMIKTMIIAACTRECNKKFPCYRLHCPVHRWHFHGQHRRPHDHNWSNEHQHRIELQRFVRIDKTKTFTFHFALLLKIKNIDLQDFAWSTPRFHARNGKTSRVASKRRNYSTWWCQKQKRKNTSWAFIIYHYKNNLFVVKQSIQLTRYVKTASFQFYFFSA